MPQKGGAPPREVEVSKAMSYLLRHGATKEGVEMEKGGWVNVAHVLSWRRLINLKVTLPELQSIVATNTKQRFELEVMESSPADSNDPAAGYRIRATQGHSITSLTNEDIFEPVLLTDPDCPNLVCHGTYDTAWKLIRRDGGLSPMQRTHIHFNTRLPPPMPKQDLKCQSKSKPEEEGLEPLVLSGMRASASIVIWVDVKRSLKGGVKWWRAKNGVYLTEGLVVGRKKLLALEWIWWVERRARPGEETEVLFGEKPAKVDGIARAGEVDGKMKGLLSGEPESGLPVKDNWDDPE